MFNNSNERAVSPVVGVMLMVVVTIIIAAVVSAFAGGIKAPDKAPQMTMDGTYSISKGMTITHTGGDTINVKQVYMSVSPGSSFYIAQYAKSMVNKSTIWDGTYDSSKTRMTWLDNYAGGSGVQSWATGQSFYIVPPEHNHDALQPGISLRWQFDNPDNIGKSVLVQITDEKGRLVSQTEIPIVA